MTHYRRTHQNPLRLAAGNLFAKWDVVLASQGLSTNLPKPQTRKRFKADAHLAYQEYLEHPTAQFTMTFSEYRKGGRNKLNKKESKH